MLVRVVAVLSLVVVLAACVAASSSPRNDAEPDRFPRGLLGNTK